jgi:hypothetical protein
MSSAKPQNHRFFHSAGSLGLLGVLVAGFAWACVSSSSDGENSGSGTGGTLGNAGTSSSQGGGNPGSSGAGGAPNNAPCTMDAGAVTGPTCAMSPGIATLTDSCTFGSWNMSDGTLSGGLSCWSGITGTCSGGSMHVTGTYPGYAVASTNGNAGCNTFFNVGGDAGPGCSILDASNHKGIQFDITVTNVPDNTLIVGVDLTNGNALETTVTTLVAGTQTVKLPWAQLPPKNNCGPRDGSIIKNVYLVFKWFNDAVDHAVDATFTNIGFYD